jgi:hypothetical protein
MDSEETNDPEDEVEEFIDEIEVANSTETVTAAPVLATNPDYNPKCPGLDHRNCH